jgi:hypothetical protein
VHVYTGNVHDRAGGTTHCAGCGRVLIERDWHEVLRYELTADGCCPDCGDALAALLRHAGSLREAPHSGAGGGAVSSGSAGA